MEIIESGTFYEQLSKYSHLIDKFLGKSSCFSGTNGQVIQCADDDITISE